MSDVPLHPNSHIGDEWSDPEVTAIEKYGDARAAEARRLALMDALRRARPHLLLCADLSIVDQLDALLREYDKEKS